MRQLENICHWLTVMAPAQLVDAKDLPPELQPRAPSRPAGGDGVGGRHRGAVRARRCAGGRARRALRRLPSMRRRRTATPGKPADGADRGWLAGLERQARELLRSGQPMVWETLTREFEAQLIRSALELTRGRRIEAAHKLGIGRNTITRKIQELGLDDK